MNFRKYFKKPKSQFLIAIIMVAVVFCVIILAQIISKSNFNKNKTGSANFNFSASDKASNFANQMDSNSIESVANRVSQSVVSIVSKNQNKVVTTSRGKSCGMTIRQIGIRANKRRNILQFRLLQRFSARQIRYKIVRILEWRLNNR